MLTSQMGVEHITSPTAGGLIGDYFNTNRTSYPENLPQDYQRDWRSEKPSQVASVNQTTQTTQAIDALDGQQSGQDSSQDINSIISSLTPKDQSGPSSLSVSQSPMGGFSYKTEGIINDPQASNISNLTNQQVPQQVVSQEPQFGTSDDFVKLYGG